MTKLKSAGLLWLLLALVGCGEDVTQNENYVEPELDMAMRMKEDIYSIEAAVTGRSEAGTERELVSDLLENYTETGLEGRPVGDSGPTYEKIVAGLQELNQTLQSNGSRSEVQKKVDELVQFAEQLPGEVDRLQFADSGGEDY